MSRRLIVASLAGLAVVAAGAPSFAAAPASVRVSTSNGVSVGASVEGIPVAGAGVTNSGQVCAGVGEQVPVCTPAVTATP